MQIIDTRVHSWGRELLEGLLEAVVKGRYPFSCFAIVVLLLAGSFMSLGQELAEKSAKPSGATAVKDIDPLQALKAATDRIHNAKAYSFNVVVSREKLGH